MISSSILRPFFARGKADQRSRFFRQMHALLRAGVEISFALSSLAEAEKNVAWRRVALEMSRLTDAGQTWNQAMSLFPALFSPLTIAIIAAAEAGGFLESACLTLADDAQREYEIYQAIKREAWYPKVLLFFSTVLVPLPLQIGPLVLDFWAQIFLIAGVWGAWRAINFLWPLGADGGEVRLGLDALRLKIPIAGATIRALAIARFYRFLSLTYHAGLSLPRGVDLAAAACGNAVIARDLAAIIPLLQGGSSLTKALIKTGQVPKTAVPLLQSGEISGDLGPQLQAAAHFLETEAETTLRKSVVALGIGVFLLVALKIGAQLIQNRHIYG